MMMVNGTFINGNDENFERHTRYSMQIHVVADVASLREAAASRFNLNYTIFTLIIPI